MPVRGKKVVVDAETREKYALNESTTMSKLRGAVMSGVWLQPEWLK